MVASISIDIVRSTSLNTGDQIELVKQIRGFLDDLEIDYPGFWARIIRGDSIECFVPEYRFALRIAILIKLYLKKQVSPYECSEMLKRYGVRLSIGMGDIQYVSKADDFINGPAINLSGRNLDRISREGVYSAIEVDGASQSINNFLDSYLALISDLVDSYSAKLAEVVFYQFLGIKEKDIANHLGIKQSSVNIRSTSAQWGLLNTAIYDFEQLDLERICG